MKPAKSLRQSLARGPHQPLEQVPEAVLKASNGACFSLPEWNPVDPNHRGYIVEISIGTDITAIIYYVKDGIRLKDEDFEANTLEDLAQKVHRYISSKFNLPTD